LFYFDSFFLYFHINNDMMKFNWNFDDINKKLYGYAKHRFWNNFTGLLQAQLNAKKYYCNKNNKISCKEFANLFCDNYNDIKKCMENDVKFDLPFKLCACIPIIFQICVYYRVLYLIKDIEIRKLFFRIYLDDYELLINSKSNIANLYDDEKIISVCGNISVQLYTRIITEDIFKLCVKFLNEKIRN